MKLKDPRVGQTALIFAVIFAALNAGMVLSRFEMGRATGVTVATGILSAVSIVFFVIAILWFLWKDGARRP